MCSGSRMPNHMSELCACQKLSISSYQYEISSTVKPCRIVVHHSHRYRPPWRHACTKDKTASTYSSSSHSKNVGSSCQISRGSRKRTSQGHVPGCREAEGAAALSVMGAFVAAVHAALAVFACSF